MLSKLCGLAYIKLPGCEMLMSRAYIKLPGCEMLMSRTVIPLHVDVVVSVFSPEDGYSMFRQTVATPYESAQCQTSKQCQHLTHCLKTSNVTQ
jgi:hypothetical protein